MNRDALAAEFTPELLRKESRAVFRLAAPVALVQLGMMIMGTVDTMMLGRVSETALAAGGLGHAIHIAVLIFPMGFLMALDPLVAQAYGAGDDRAVGEHLLRGILVAFGLMIPGCLLLWNARPLLLMLDQSPEVAAASSAYLRGVSASLIADLIFIVLRQTLQAMSIVRPLIIAIVVANATNIFVNWVLIFGNLGFPECGVVGSAWSTTISRGVMMLTLAAFGLPFLRRFLHRIEKATLDPRKFLTHLRIGVPIAFHISIELWFFSIMAVLMGTLGARQLAGHQVALSLASITFMVPLGIGAAAAARTGNAVGRGDPAGARRAAFVCLTLGASVMSVSAFLFAVFPAALARLYTPDPEVIVMAATLLPIAALFQIFDGTQAVAAGILRGAADTRVPALIALVGFWGFGLPLAWALTFRWGAGPQGLWWGMTVALGAVSMLLVARVVRTYRGEIEALSSGEPSEVSDDVGESAG